MSEKDRKPDPVQEAKEVLDANAKVTELKPVFEPGYFVDNSMTEEYRDEHGYGPRRVTWFDQDPEDTDWVRVNVTDRNF